MAVSSILINPDGRIRSGWRLVIFLLSFAVVAALLAITGIALLRLVMPGVVPHEQPGGRAVLLALNGVALLIAALLVGWLCAKYLEGRPFRSLGFMPTGKWISNFGWGALLGTLTILAAVCFAAIAAGFGLQFGREHDHNLIAGHLVSSLLTFALWAAWEEALFRGYILQTFARAGLGWLAILLTSAFFAAVHIGNPGSNLISTANTALAGIWLGLAYLKTRDLWFPFALHLVWNWMQGSVFGIEVSGLKELAAASVFKEVDSGPAWITGADYGIEAGISATIALLISTAIIYFSPFPRADTELLALTSAERPVEIQGQTA